MTSSTDALVGTVGGLLALGIVTHMAGDMMGNHHHHSNRRRRKKRSSYDNGFGYWWS
jgi:hypothetical protein